VIVETKALRDVTTRQLADFALVRGLMPADVSDRPPSSASILSLFNPGVTPEGGPQSLTRWDLGFLRALGSVRSDSYASLQRDEIREAMLKDAERTPADQR